MKLSRGIALLGVLLVASALSSGCHDEGDVKVASLKFEGNRAFKSGQLSDLMVTQSSGWLPWARPRFFNREVFDRDLESLIAFYEDRGYPEAKISGVEVNFNEKKDAVRLVVRIDEGEPLVVERVDFSGLDGVPQETIDRLKTLPQAAGKPRDRQAVAASRERVTFLLRDSGYAHARVESEETSGSGTRQAVIRFTAHPGPLTTFGDVSVVGLSSVREQLVMRSLSFRPDEQYRLSLVTESQRKLGSLGIFTFAHVGPDPKTEGAAPARLPMTVTLAEGKPQRYQIGVGYGTEDGPRGSIQWEHLNFLGDARRLSVEARYGARLRGVGTDFTEPYFLSRRLSLTMRAGGWWADEPTHASRRLGGRIGLTHRGEFGRGIDVEPIVHVIRAGYLHDSLSYTIDPATLADLSQFDDLIALGLDPVTRQGRGRLAAVDFDFERTAVDHPTDPHAGYAAYLHGKHAAAWLGGNFRYDEIVTEGRAYVPVGRAHVWATRARLGAIIARPSAPVPVSERYFLGGSANLRGWGRYQVAPLTPNGLPTGGRALVDLSTELRLNLWGSFGAVAFLDAGNVWRAPTDVDFGDLLYAAGPGLRWISPIGVIRGDFAWQLKRLQNLQLDGAPERLRWRIHVSIGHTF